MSAAGLGGCAGPAERACAPGKSRDGRGRAQAAAVSSGGSLAAERSGAWAAGAQGAAHRHPQKRLRPEGPRPAGLPPAGPPRSTQSPAPPKARGVRLPRAQRAWTVVVMAAGRRGGRGRQAKLELQFDMETEAGKIGPVEKVPPGPAARESGPVRPLYASLLHAPTESQSTASQQAGRSS